MCGQSAARVMAWDLESVGKKKGGTAGGGCDISMNMMLSAGELIVSIMSYSDVLQDKGLR